MKIFALYIVPRLLHLANGELGHFWCFCLYKWYKCDRYRWALKTLANQPVVRLLYRTKGALGLNVLKQRQPSAVTSISGIIADVQTENILQSVTALRSASLPVRETNTCWIVSEKIFRLSRNPDMKKLIIMKNHLCTDQGSKCNVPHINLSVLNLCEIHIDADTCQSKHFHFSD